jgi:hypothetical protein
MIALVTWNTQRCVLLNIPILETVKQVLEMLMMYTYHAKIFTGVLFEKMETLL